MASAIHLGGDDYSEDWEPEFMYMQGYPFEVTIKATGKKLTITVVDDPEEDGTEYELVNNLTIPRGRGRQRGACELGTGRWNSPRVSL